MPVTVPKAWLWRAIKAKCYDCRGGYRGMDCEVTTCPLYLFLPQANFEPDCWWVESADQWRFTLQEALDKKHKQIKVVVPELAAEKANDLTEITQANPSACVVAVRPKPLYGRRSLLRSYL